MKRSNQNEIKSKSIKVAYSARTRADRNSFAGSTRDIFLPKIQMEGKWLENLGFHIGDRLNVEYGNGVICISHADAEPEGQLGMVAESARYMVTEKQ